MKRRFILASILLSLSTIAFAQQSGDFVVPLSNPNQRGKLKAHVHFGSITVKGSPRKDVLVKYTAVERDPKQGNRDGLKRITGEAMDLEITENNNVVRIGSNSFSNGTDLEIEVPLDFDLTVTSFNEGAMFISNVSGELELTNHNDDITAENISGSVLATSFNGELKISFNKVKEGVPMSFSTFNGDIDITFPATLKATFKMKTEQGEVLSDFDMNMIKEAPVQRKETSGGTYKVVIDGSIKAQVNGGGPEFIIKNHNGDIIIRKR